MQQNSDIVSLYFSKKLKGFIGKEFFEMATVPDDHIEDEFYRWYGDIFYINRKKYLIFCNGAAKFTFIIPDYRVDHKTSFFKTFTRYLRLAMEHTNFNPDHYLEGLEFFSHDTTVNRSAMAHLTQVKDMLLQVIHIENFPNSEDDELEYMNHYINAWITTFKDRKGYHEPRNCFKEEWEKRGLAVDKRDNGL